ncbi:MAG TPA: STAS domain-containing protein [Solirubrobacteraceae bacterium]|jgi:anti-sigma B factor antagonist|nr:STAS domain-containing protein [Solirubrobacteraceae bacterium]
MNESSRPPEQLEVREHEADDGQRTLVLVGELDIASVPVLQRAVERMRSDATTSITLDLRGLTFIDSTGLAAIVLASKVCDTNGYGFALIRGAASTQRLFELTGLIDVLPFRDEDEDEGKVR